MDADRKYKFDWSLLGDVTKGRPHLGNQVSVKLYRLLHFTFRDAMEQAVGSKQTDEILFSAGHLAGTSFYQNMLQPPSDFNEFTKLLQNAFKEHLIGILRFEKVDLDKGEVVLTVSEDLECSGLEEQGTEICKYDEGFVAGILEAYFGHPFLVKEVDCWGTGNLTCRFYAKAVKE